MEAEAMEAVARAAAHEAVREFKKDELKKKRAKIFQNTKLLMENYNRMAKSVDEGVSELSDLTDEPIEGLDPGEDLFIESIVKSKLRSLVMLAHVDKCLKLLEVEQYQKGTPEKIITYKNFYLEGMTYESIADEYGYSERTARRWVIELNNILSVYLFGSDALMF